MKLFKVVAGSLTRGDKRYGFGDTIELTDAEAASAFYKARVLEVGARVPVGGDNGQAERIAELEAQLTEAQMVIDANAGLAERIAELEAQLTEAQMVIDANAGLAERIAELEGQLAAGVTVNDAPPPPPKVKK